MTFWQVTLQLLEGFKVTILLFIMTLVSALPLGLIFAFGSRAKFKPLSYLTRGFVYVVRGTPLLLQLMIVIYLPGIAFSAPITKWAVFGGNVSYALFFGALFAFVINYACYFSEIYRGGIDSISRGQYEACAVLGMTKKQTFFKVILLQVIKRILAPVGNETITLVKDTALVRVVAVAEILFFANEILSLKMMIWPLFYTGVFYLIFNSILTWLFNKFEKKLNYFWS